MRGISPVVSATLLIAIAMAVSLIFYAWSSQTVRVSLENQTETYHETMGCIESSFKVTDYSIEDLTFSGSITNNGRHRLYDFKIYSATSKAIDPYPLNLTLERNQMSYFLINLKEQPTRIRIIATSDACPSVYTDVL